MGSKESFDTLKKMTQETVKKVADTTVETINNTKKKINDSIQKQKEKEQQRLQDEYDIAIRELNDSFASEFIKGIAPKPIKRSAASLGLLKRSFPIPNEQYVFWSSLTKGKKKSGIAITNKGVFVKAVLKSKTKLSFYSWELFEPSWFVIASYTDLKYIDKECREPFMVQCKKFNEFAKKDLINRESEELKGNNFGPQIGTTFVISSAFGSTTIKTSAVNAAVNGGSGHGIMAEEANNVLDRLLFKNAKIVGRDNVKNGADRLVNGQSIQSKYCKTPGKTVGSAFDSSNNGMYKYITKDGKLMQLEVPKDQYNQAVKNMEGKIKQGKVPGVTDPAEAKNIVRKGHYTYEQAKNLAKAGTVESLTYDMMTGAVISLCAFGITFVITAFVTWNQTRDVKYTLEESLKSATKVFGLTLVSQVLTNQLARTSLFNSISKTIVGGGVLSAGVSFAVFALPDTIKLVNRKMTKTQYYLNMSSLLGGIVGGTVGGIVGLKAGTAIGGATGGPIGGAVGGIVGGTLIGVGTSMVNKMFFDDDYTTYFRLINAYIMCMCNEYLFGENEIDKLFKWLGKIDTKKWTELIKSIISSDKQEETIRKFLLPHFEYINEEREMLVFDATLDGNLA